MSNAAIDILKARQTAISNDVAIKMDQYNQLHDDLAQLTNNITSLQSALLTIKEAILILEQDGPNEPTQSRTTSKSKKATS